MSHIVRPLHSFLYATRAQMSLEVLKAWSFVKQAWQARSAGINQTVLAVHIGIIELLEMIAQELGREDFSELIFLRFPKVTMYFI